MRCDFRAEIDSMRHGHHRQPASEPWPIRRFSTLSAAEGVRSQVEVRDGSPMSEPVPVFMSAPMAGPQLICPIADP
jgi:hypothetical protein